MPDLFLQSFELCPAEQSPQFSELLMADELSSCGHGILYTCEGKVQDVIPSNYSTVSLEISCTVYTKEVMYHTICVNYEAKIEAGARTDSNGRLRLLPIT